jgi:hypothetical protein
LNIEEKRRGTRRRRPERTIAKWDESTLDEFEVLPSFFGKLGSLIEPPLWPERLWIRRKVPSVAVYFGTT